MLRVHSVSALIVRSVSSGILESVIYVGARSLRISPGGREDLPGGRRVHIRDSIVGWWLVGWANLRSKQVCGRLHDGTRTRECPGRIRMFSNYPGPGKATNALRCVFAEEKPSGGERTCHRALGSITISSVTPYTWYSNRKAFGYNSEAAASVFTARARSSASGAGAREAAGRHPLPP